MTATGLITLVRELDEECIPETGVLPASRIKKLQRGQFAMANSFQPRVGDWYQNISGDNFEIVAHDADEATVEIQYFDGAIEEIDSDSWHEMEIQPIEPPEDWSGSLDIERDDYGVDLELTAPNDHINPLDELE
jgi:hypothetical protein